MGRRRKVADCRRCAHGNVCAWRDNACVACNQFDPMETRTCHSFGGKEGTNGEGYDFACSACGYCCDLSDPNYCPHCGAMVVSNDA